MTEPHHVKELKATYAAIDQEMPPAIRASRHCQSRVTTLKERLRQAAAVKVEQIVGTLWAH